MTLVSKVFDWVPEVAISVVVSLTGAYVAHVFVPVLHANVMLYFGFLCIVAAVTFSSSFAFRQRHMQRVGRARMEKATSRPVRTSRIQNL